MQGAWFELAQDEPLSACPVGTVKGVSYLVDPASSHMLASKIKPCIYERSHCETVNGSLNQL